MRLAAELAAAASSLAVSAAGGVNYQWLCSNIVK